MYEYIVNPKTGRKVNVNGTIGRKVIQNYLKQLGGFIRSGSRMPSCDAYRQDGGFIRSGSRMPSCDAYKQALGKNYKK